MALPLLPYIIAGLVSTAAALTTYYNWTEIKKYFKGKNLVILGTIGTGKTTLHKFLRYGEIVKIHNNTRRTEKVKGNKFKLEKLELKISEGIDISGQKDFEKEWKHLFEGGDICFYLFNSFDVYCSDEVYIEKINNHLKHIGKWKDECKIIPRVIVIGTFIDQIPGFDKLNESNIQSLDEILRNKIQMGLLNGKISSSEFFIGNLGNGEGIKSVMNDILKYLAIK